MTHRHNNLLTLPPPARRTPSPSPPATHSRQDTALHPDALHPDALRPDALRPGHRPLSTSQSKQKEPPLGGDPMGKKSSVSEVKGYISELINKSKERELAATDKFILKGYIDIYIREYYLGNWVKDKNRAR